MYNVSPENMKLNTLSREVRVLIHLTLTRPVMDNLLQCKLKSMASWSESASAWEQIYKHCENIMSPDLSIGWTKEKSVL